MKTKGFTLVEVIISMCIMSMLTVLVSSAIRSAVQNKRRLEARMASEMSLFDGLRLIKQDVERAFHYQDVFFELETLALAQVDSQKKPSNPSQRRPSPTRQAPRQAPPKLTHFLGESDRMDFTTLNHFRHRYNAQESDQMEVGYFVDSCLRLDGKGNTQCLWRRSHPFIDDRVDEGGIRQIVAYHVTDFKLEYRSEKEVDDWVTQWRSDNRGRRDHRHQFPHFVKIHLAIEDKGNKKVKAIKDSIVAPILFPNNTSYAQRQRSLERGFQRGAGPAGAGPTGGFNQGQNQ